MSCAAEHGLAHRWLGHEAPGHRRHAAPRDPGRRRRRAW